MLIDKPYNIQFCTSLALLSCFMYYINEIIRNGPQKYKTLSLNDKIKVIKQIELGIKKKKDITYEFKIPANTLSNILKKKETILQIKNNLFNTLRKRVNGSMKYLM